MKQFLAFLTTLLYLLPGFHAVAQPKPAPGKSLLWSIKSNKTQKTSYLFGTIHMICSEDYLWTPKMKQCFDASEKVCFELDLDDPSIMLKVAGGLMDMTGKKLHEYFSPADYELIKKYVKDSLHQDIAMFESLKPIALQSMLTTSGLNCTHPVAYEDSLMPIAQHQNKEILGLEVPEEQLTALESIPVDSVIKQLLDELKTTDRSDSDYTNLVAAYKKQDLPELYKLITTSKELGDDLDIFLDDRNTKWIPRIAEKMEKSSVFFAVGAGHLWGSHGVIQLLKEAGYTVEQLN